MDNTRTTYQAIYLDQEQLDGMTRSGINLSRIDDSSALRMCPDFDARTQKAYVSTRAWGKIWIVRS